MAPAGGIRAVGELRATALCALLLLGCSASAVRVGLFMDESTGSLDLKWDNGPSNLERVMRSTFGSDLRVFEEAQPKLTGLDAYVIPPQRGDTLFSATESMDSVAEFVRQGGLVIYHEANHAQGQGSRDFVAKALELEGGWAACKVMDAAERSRSTLSSYASSFLSTENWPATLEVSSSVMTRCRHEDKAATAVPLYTVKGDDRVVVQAFGKAGVAGAVVVVAHSWKDGEKKNFAALYEKLANAFAEGAYEAPESGNAEEQSVDSVLEVAADASEAAAEVVRRFLQGSVPSYPPPSPPASPSCNPGYELVNGTCTDIDECLVPAKASTCSLAGTICKNTPGSFECKALPRVPPGNAWFLIRLRSSLVATFTSSNPDAGELNVFLLGFAGTVTGACGLPSALLVFLRISINGVVFTGNLFGHRRAMIEGLTNAGTTETALTDAEFPVTRLASALKPRALLTEMTRIGEPMAVRSDDVVSLLEFSKAIVNDPEARRMLQAGATVDIEYSLTYVDSAPFSPPLSPGQTAPPAAPSAPPKATIDTAAIAAATNSTTTQLPMVPPSAPPPSPAPPPPGTPIPIPVPSPSTPQVIIIQPPPPPSPPKDNVSPSPVSSPPPVEVSSPPPSTAPPAPNGTIPVDGVQYMVASMPAFGARGRTRRLVWADATDFANQTQPKKPLQLVDRNKGNCSVECRGCKFAWKATNNSRSVAIFFKDPFLMGKISIMQTRNTGVIRVQTLKWTYPPLGLTSAKFIKGTVYDVPSDPTVCKSVLEITNMTAQDAGLDLPVPTDPFYNQANLPTDLAEKAVGGVIITILRNPLTGTAPRPTSGKNFGPFLEWVKFDGKIIYPQSSAIYTPYLPPAPPMP